MSINAFSTPAKPAGKSYFGIVALVIAVISGLFLGANLGVAYLNITPATFSQLNNLTALLYCILAPFSAALGVIGYLRRNDSRRYSLIAFVLVAIPFFVLMIQIYFAFRSGAITVE